MRLTLDAFGGPGGVSEGLRSLGIEAVGIERDPAACATRCAAGHRTIRGDVTVVPLDHLAGKVDGLWMSPPCPAFSSAGNGEGRDLIGRYVALIDRGQWQYARVPGVLPGSEVLEVGRWAETLRPRWVACEQVPPVLPIWQAYAQRWRALFGWSAWAGILNSADFGVPQTRRRAILIARTDGRPALPPEPTHSEHPQQSMFSELAPWVSMAEALGWAGDTPARTLCGDRVPRWLYPDLDGSHGRVVLRNGAQSQWVWERPATTVAGDPRLSGPGRNDPDVPGSQYGENSVKLTLAEALVLQGFPPDYPVQGNKTRCFEQVGNAVPPPLAAAVVSAFVAASQPGTGGVG